MQKYQTSFWKTRKAKFTNKVGFSDFIDGFNNASVIADTFACMFEGAFGSNSSESNKRLFSEFTTTQVSIFVIINKYDKNKVYISVENVGKCLHAMKLGKAAGCDGIETEHMVNAYPILVSILAALFNAMPKHGYVPDNCGRGIIIPLIKDKSGDASSSSNYRGITLSSNISKLFEMCLLDLFGKYRASLDLQFGFKKGVGCRDAIYALQSVVDFYMEHGTTVNLCLLICQKPLIKLIIMVCTLN